MRGAHGDAGGEGGDGGGAGDGGGGDAGGWGWGGGEAARENEEDRRRYVARGWLPEEAVAGELGMGEESREGEGRK
ncbi:MAG TPA: hypothetical protein VH482_09130 [Thermomicrobiales bacterium]